MLIPALLEFMELGKFHIPAMSQHTGDFGSLMLRFIIVYAGQVSRC